MIEYHKFGFRDSNRGRIKCHGPELKKTHGITHACIKTCSLFFHWLFWYHIFNGIYLVLWEFAKMACVITAVYRGQLLFLLSSFLCFLEVIWSCIQRKETYGITTCLHRHTYYMPGHMYTFTVCQTYINSCWHCHVYRASEWQPVMSLCVFVSVPSLSCGVGSTGLKHKRSQMQRLERGGKKATPLGITHDTGPHSVFYQSKYRLVKPTVLALFRKTNCKSPIMSILYKAH